MTIRQKLELLLNEHIQEVLQDYKTEGNTQFYLEMAQADVLEDLMHVIIGHDEQVDQVHDYAWDVLAHLRDIQHDLVHKEV